MLALGATRKRMSLRPLSRFQQLRRLFLEGHTKDIQAISGLTTLADLRYLELWLIRGLNDLSPVAGMAHLEYLFLQALRRVELLPDFSGSRALKRVWLETMKGLTDFSSLASAPSLEHVALIDMAHLAPEAVTPLLDCPELRSVRAGFGSTKKNRRAQEILGSLTEGDGDVWDRSPYRFPVGG